MKRFFAFAVIFMITAVASVEKVQGQNPPAGLSQQSLQGIGSQYFVDETGLQLLQTATPLDNFIDESHYFLGPYDVLSIYGKGLVEFSYRGIVINAIGDISTPLIGTVSLRGKSLAEAKEIISEAFENQVRETEIHVTLDQPRPVSIHIGGNIPNPGRYIVPAGTRYDALVSGFYLDDKLFKPLVNQDLETVIQASSQRPSYSGLNFDKLDAKQQEESEEQNEELNRLLSKYDLRQVKVTPLLGNEFFVDLAGYFNSGNPVFAPFIKDGDHITLIDASPNRQTVGISGAVNNSFTGSYRSDDTFQNLLSIAGGFSPDADSSIVVIIRGYGDDFFRKELHLTDIGEVLPGDQFIVKYKSSDSSTGTISIKGEVELPGSFVIQNGKTSLADLLELVGGLTEKALPNGAYLIRNSYDNRGVNSVSSINLSLLGRSSDQFLEGFDYLEFEQAMNPNRMALDLNSDRILQQTKLQNGDQIYIPKDENTISVLGQVNVPGFYNFNPDFTASDYLSAADGFSVAADKDRVFVIKAGSKAWYRQDETSLESGDIIFVDRIPFEDVSTGRNYLLELERQKSERVRLVMSGLSTIAGLITAYVAVRNLN